MKPLEIIEELKRKNVVPKLADDQLKLTGETRNLSQEFIDQIKAAKGELIEFLSESIDALSLSPIRPVAKQSDYPVSNAQKRIWVVSQFEGASAAYNITRGFYLKGAVNRENLNKAFLACIKRHEVLRTVFKEKEGEPRQIIMEDSCFGLEYQDISGREDIKEYLRSEESKLITGIFDLERGPLIRVKLLGLSAQEHAMIFSIHHIISDGWSIGILVKEVMRFYESFCKNEESVFLPLTIQYKEYTYWLETKINGPKGRKSMGFWKDQFSGSPKALNLPADLNRSDKLSFEGGLSKFYFEKELYARILLFCRRHHITLFNFFRATLSILLSKFSTQRDITIGTPVSGRNHFDLEGQIGLYVNTLPLRILLDMKETFSSFLKRVSDHSILAFEFQDYPFDRIVEDLQVKRDAGRNPLFDVMMVLQDSAMSNGGVDMYQQYGFELNLLDDHLYAQERMSDKIIAAKLDLNFNFDSEPGDKYYLEIEYASALFSKSRIGQLFDAYIRILSQVLENPEAEIGSIGIISGREEKKILYEFNRPIGIIEEYSIWELLAGSFSIHADKTAMLAGEEKVTYAELNERSAIAACYFSAIIKDGQDTFIGLLMDRSSWMISILLGIIRAGAAYLPIDTKYPMERVRYMIDDARPICIIVDDKGSSKVPQDYKGRVVHISELADLPEAEVGPAHRVDLREKTAYVIYTSGSTGHPKGVEICHRNTIAFLKWAKQEFCRTSFEILYAATSYCFDLSIFEFFFPLMEGKTIRLLDSAMEIAAYVDTDEAIMINTVPSVVRTLLEEGVNWGNITALNMAGEPVPKGFKNMLDFRSMEVRNLYGPTEDTTYSTVYLFKENGFLTIPIGVPAGYRQLYIMDADNNLMPIGIDGEICLSGHSVAKGYLNKPALNAKSFIQNPLIAGVAMYRTGDTGRWLPDGNIEFAGRTDNQVKIRGHRIELGEIQHLLEEHGQVEQAVVVAVNIDTDLQIAAYWKGGTEASASRLRDYLSERLPAYMIPVYWIRLEEIPLNSNGKLDKKALPPPGTGLSRETGSIAPRSSIEQMIWEIWKQLLPAVEFGVNENFFELGGHSLKAIKLRSLLAKGAGKDLSLNEIFEHPTIEAQARVIEGKARQILPSIPKVAGSPYYPISIAQERLWVVLNFEEASKVYNMSAAFRVKGKLDVKKLEAAFRVVIGRHEILRTVYAEKEGKPVQIVLQPGDIGFTLDEISIDGVLSAEGEYRYLQEQWNLPFDLINGPLHRCLLLTTRDSRLLSFTMHHMISDGWSVVLLYKEVTAIYRRLLEGGAEIEKASEIQYRDFACWQRDRLVGEGLSGPRLFWKEMFRDGVPVLEMPTDHHRPEIKSYDGSVFNFQFDPGLSQKMRRLAKRTGASSFMVIMAGVAVLLKKYSNQNDMVIGTVVAGRDHYQLQDQLGFYANTLAIRTRIEAGESFQSLINRQKAILLRAYEFQDFPFEVLVEELGVKRDLSRAPLFDVMVVLQDLEGMDGDGRQVAPGLEFDPVSLHAGTAKYDLGFSFREGPEGLSLELEYNTGLFERNTIARLALYLSRVFDIVTEDPEIYIRDITLMDERQRAVLLQGVDRTSVRYDTRATLVSLFEKAVADFPERTALSWGEGKMSYKELHKRSGQLAAILVHDHGVRSGELITLHFDRSEWMIISILGVLKAGAAYVPVDPAYPPGRITYMLDDCGSRLVLSDSLLPEAIREGRPNTTFIDIAGLVYAGEGLSTAVDAHDPAYVIYTSGTTGEPKGVLIGHGNVVRLLFNSENPFDFTENDRWSLFHSYCFDFSVWEMYGALLNGGELVIAPKETTQNSLAFYDFLRRGQITVLNQTPSAFRSLVQHNHQRFTEDPLVIRYLIFGGEALRPDILKEWHHAMPFCKNINMYGITETTVHVTYKEITALEILDNKSNIGLPIPTLCLYVLDTDLRQVPAGVTGELCVGGAGVAKGYLNKPELTAEKFIDDPAHAGAKLYRSGDFARILSSGDIEYIGRKDDQVKIRGYRIEVGEVEAAVAGLDCIRDVIVLALKNSKDEYELAAYYISAAELDHRELFRKLKELLPAYMVPSYLIALPAFPLNSNGKLDRALLPGPGAGAERHTEHVACRNDTDERIAAIWESILEIRPIGIRDNFFDLGGHSLKATRVISQIQQVFGVPVDLKRLFSDPTIEHLSDYVATLQWVKSKEATFAEGSGEMIF